jgi:DNA gyrase subunit A
MAIRFQEDKVRSMGRTAKGVTGIKFEGDDSLVSMTVLAQDRQQTEDETEELTLLTICENGYGKRTLISEYRAQNRAGKGLIDIQTEGRNGPVIESLAVTSQSGLMLITSSGKIIRTSAKDISVIGRNTRGVRLINLVEGEKVVAVAPAPLDTNEGDADGEEAPAIEETSTPADSD